LLIGGQACIIYGAAEFSRDSDFVVLCDAANLDRLRKALGLLKAVNIYVPPLDQELLEKGHACHFRCLAKGAERLRIDVLGKMRGCGSFDELWPRRFVLDLPGAGVVNALALEDLVQSKKTQRDKDWLMLKRLVDNDMFLTPKPSAAKISWWLQECRTAAELIRLAKRHKKAALACARSRSLLKTALRGDSAKLEALLRREELGQRQADRAYWLPLVKELEVMRHVKGRASGHGVRD
jgi:hypothetical protein